MSKKPTTEAERLLTGVELELMTIVWRLGEGTVNDVLAALPASRPLAYTSVSTILRILQEKGVLGFRKQGRTHVYVPNVSKAEYEAQSLRKLIAGVFDGAPADLVRCLVENERMSRSDLEELGELLSRAGKARK